MKEKYEKIVIFIAFILAVLATSYFFQAGHILAYGDAESHLNIAKRVVHSLTPGLAQFGGIWLPLPHALMTPLVYFDPLWRSGLAGSIVSGLSFIIATLFIYKLTMLVTGSKTASFFAFLVFALNPNVLYMQSTPMTEIPLIAFFTGSTYFFIKFLRNRKDFLSLILAASFGFFATLTRYDGWFLVIFETLAITFLYAGKTWKILEGKVVFFSTMAFFGIVLWLLWDLAILGDPFYFTNSPFSAKSQQSGWLIRGELPAYKDILLSVIYYLDTAMRNSGLAVFGLFILGLILFIFKERKKIGFITAALMLVPFSFYIVTLFLGQSVIFIPDLTPESFQWRLFNVRYGMMAIPAIAFFTGYLFFKSHLSLKIIFAGIFTYQLIFFALGITPVITLQDGVTGLSAGKVTNAQYWMSGNYDGGLVLMDDYARTMSIIRSNIPMQNLIYIGNKPYWEESLKQPEKYARWIVLQKDDAVWKALYADSGRQGQLFKYFQKAYTSPEILIFKRTGT